MQWGCLINAIAAERSSSSLWWPDREKTRVLGPAIPSHWQLEAAWPGRQPQVPALFFTFSMFIFYFLQRRRHHFHSLFQVLG
jgi:hypothetical protein